MRATIAAENGQREAPERGRDGLRVGERGQRRVDERAEHRGDDDGSGCAAQVHESAPAGGCHCGHTPREHDVAQLGGGADNEDNPVADPGPCAERGLSDRRASGRQPGWYHSIWRRVCSTRRSVTMSDTLVFVCGDADQYTAMAEPMRELGWETEMVDPASATALETIEATAPVATVFNLATGPEQAVHELAKAMLGDPDLPRPLARVRWRRLGSCGAHQVRRPVWRVRGRRRAHLGAQTPRVQGLRLLVSRQIYWVVPAYNEAASIAGPHRPDRRGVHRRAGWRWELIVVDDGSARYGPASSHGRRAQTGCRSTVLRNEPNAGLGCHDPPRTAGRQLTPSGPDDVIVTLDADLTQDPGYAPAMLVAKLDEGYADVVIASRYRPGLGRRGALGVSHDC